MATNSKSLSIALLILLILFLLISSYLFFNFYFVPSEKTDLTINITLLEQNVGRAIQQTQVIEEPINFSSGSSKRSSNSCSRVFLDEYRCNGNWLEQKYTLSDCSQNWKKIILCENGCDNNACLPSHQNQTSCNSDADCNDNDPRTVDECIFPGTEKSFCRNTKMNCLLDSDCGNSGFIEKKFCSQNNLFQSFQSSVCINKGTLESYCEVNIFPEKIQDCLSGCVEESCLP